MLREIARFNDVYDADLAAAFMEAHGISVSVTERFQTTIDPLMQQALGIRLMVHVADVQQARDLLARVQAGEFRAAEPDDLPARGTATRAAGTVMALAAFLTNGFWGVSLPRRFRAPSWQGMLLSAAGVLILCVLGLILVKLLIYPP